MDFAEVVDDDWLFEAWVAEAGEARGADHERVEGGESSPGLRVGGTYGGSEAGKLGALMGVDHVFDVELEGLYRQVEDVDGRVER